MLILQVKCDALSEDGDTQLCGNDFAYIYFISFYMLCSFLVRSQFCNHKTPFQWHLNSTSSLGLVVNPVTFAVGQNNPLVILVECWFYIWKSGGVKKWCWVNAKVVWKVCILLLFRSSTCSSLWSWIISTIWRATGRFWVRIIWTNSSAFGPNTIQTQSMQNSGVKSVV